MSELGRSGRKTVHSECKATRITVEPSRVLLGPQQSIVVDCVSMLLLVVAGEWRPEDD